MARLGSQQPTWSHIGDYAESAGERAVAYFAKHGARFYESQKLEFELMLARDADGGFAAKSLCITKPRQNGKSYAARWYVLWMAMVCGLRCLFSAHHSRTSRDMFKQLCDMLDPTVDAFFAKQVESIYRAGGYEGIYFRNGGCIEFQTRTNSGGRGGTYSVLVLDEAQELTPAQQDALLPTVSAAGEIAEGESEPQKIYIGTVPGPECQGTVFREMHDRVHAGESDIWWLEWGAQGEKLDDIDTDSIDLWYACNPAMGRRMRESTVKDEHDTMTRDGFARERLGWWSPTAGLPDFVIQASAFESLAVDNAPTQGRAAYGVKFSVDGSEVSLAACRLHDGKAYVEQVRREPLGMGLGWLAEWIAARKAVGCCCVIDGKAGAPALVDKLGKMPANYIITPTAAQVVAANATLVDYVNERKLEWFRPQADLRDSAITSTRRKIGSSGGWGFGGENPIPIDAASLARWGALNSKRNPERKQRIG